jgi:anthranilate phosphoribosyltransferase
MESFRDELRRVVEGRATLTQAESAALLGSILRGEASEIELAGLLAAMAMRGETAPEMAGFAQALRAAAVPVPLGDAERADLVDSCGTGGDGSGTFNISTAAGLVAAAVGARVAKHGNRAVTSACGSADVLEALGIPVGLSPAQGAAALRHHGFAFFHAPSLHPAMKAVMPVRRALGIRTIFNVVGPLANPAGARAQVMGVYAAHLVPLAAEALRLLGTRHALVVHGATDEGAGMDELSISGESTIAEVRDGAVRSFRLQPEDFGIEPAPVSALRGGSAAENAAILRAIFAGEAGPRRDVVLLNAAAVLLVAERTPDLREGLASAAAAIDSGKVAGLIATLAG